MGDRLSEEMALANFKSDLAGLLKKHDSSIFFCDEDGYKWCEVDLGRHYIGSSVLVDGCDISPSSLKAVACPCGSGKKYKHCCGEE